MDVASAYLLDQLPTLNSDMKRLLKAYLRSPSQKGWDRIHGIILPHTGKTVWQTLLRLDPTFPRSGPSDLREGRWERIPSVNEIKAVLQETLASNVSPLEEKPNKRFKLKPRIRTLS